MEKQNIDTPKALLSDDELVALFLDEQRQQLPDEGFSQRVMQQLPSRSVRLSRLWSLFCAAVGVAFLVWIDGLAQLKLLLLNMLGNLEGFLSSVSWGAGSPLVLLLGLVLLTAFLAWNLAADWERA